MISVERVTEYTNLKQEARWEYEYRPPPGWPYNGWITFERITNNPLGSPLSLLWNVVTEFISKGSLMFGTQLMRKTHRGLSRGPDTAGQNWTKADLLKRV